MIRPQPVSKLFPYTTLFRSLEKGGSEHPMILYKAFRGQEPTSVALLKRNGMEASPKPPPKEGAM